MFGLRIDPPISPEVFWGCGVFSPSQSLRMMFFGRAVLTEPPEFPFAFFFFLCTVFPFFFLVCPPISFTNQAFLLHVVLSGYEKLSGCFSVRRPCPFLVLPFFTYKISVHSVRVYAIGHPPCPRGRFSWVGFLSRIIFLEVFQSNVPPYTPGLPRPLPSHGASIFFFLLFSEPARRPAESPFPQPRLDTPRSKTCAFVFILGSYVRLPFFVFSVTVFPFNPPPLFGVFVEGPNDVKIFSILFLLLSDYCLGSYICCSNTFFCVSFGLESVWFWPFGVHSECRAQPFFLRGVFFLFGSCLNCFSLSFFEVKISRSLFLRTLFYVTRFLRDSPVSLSNLQTKCLPCFSFVACSFALVGSGITFPSDVPLVIPAYLATHLF